MCGDGPAAFAFGSIDLVYAVAGLFRYERCRSCASFFQNPRAVDDDLGLYYPADYFTHLTADGFDIVGSAGRLQAFVRRIVLDSGNERRRPVLDLERWCGSVLRHVRFVRRRAMFGLVDELSPPAGVSRCLELGPGIGDDMWRLAQLGWSVTGIDLDPDAAKIASARSGCPVVVGPILDHRPEAPYGLIYGSHSIEHVPNIRDTVIHLRSLLEPRGRLVLIVPNAMSLSSTLYGPLSVVWDPPRHLSLPSVSALRTLFRDAGFTDVSIRTSGRRAAHYSAIARDRRLGVTGTAAWAATVSRRDRRLQLVETVLARLGVDVGEEIVVSATAG